MSETAQPLAADVPDREPLKRLGAAVRKRLGANPQVYKVPTDKAEIFAVGDFLTPRECQRLIVKIDEVAKPSAVFDSAYGKLFRTSYSGNFDVTDPLVRRVTRRIDDLLGLDPALGETVQGQRYLPGQEFQSHFDWFDTASDYWRHEKRRGGQRSWTAMAFLNHPEGGGTTDFTKIGLSIEPKPGALLIWNNADPEGAPNEWTMHAGMPVTAGLKYIITKWYRVRSWL
jgi:prolyl 4-hydroxylase